MADGSLVFDQNNRARGAGRGSRLARLRLPSLADEKFCDKLGSIFIPGTVQIQAPVGLTAYLPSVLPRDKPSVTPDEIAVVFYEYQAAYDEAKETVGGRAYSDLHGLVFDLTRSTSGFPIRFDGEIEPEMRYHLFDQSVDWQRGAVNVFVGVRRGDEPHHFMGQVADWLGQVQSGGGPDGAIAVCNAEYVVYWEHWAEDVESRSSIRQLGDVAEPAYEHAIAPYDLGHGLWEPYAGVEVSGGESFNFQFERRRENR